MGYEAKKTEHSGAKHGNGAYWGPKKDAKKESNKVRRRNWKKEARQEPDLRQRLMQGAIANADLDRKIAKEWSPLEEEAWAFIKDFPEGHGKSNS